MISRKTEFEVVVEQGSGDPSQMEKVLYPAAHRLVMLRTMHDGPPECGVKAGEN